MTTTLAIIKWIDVNLTSGDPLQLATVLQYTA